MVTNTFFAMLDESGRPRSRKTRTFDPKTAFAAVAPKHTMVLGRMIRTSASSHGLQAAISRGDGFLWIRRFPTGSHLKCFTALVT